MIEIEEEYKLLEWIKHLQDEYASGAWNKDDDVKFKQILQDHEDAKNHKGMMEMFGAKDWDEWGKLFTEFSDKANKDAQAVKRLEEFYSEEKLLLRSIVESDKTGSDQHLQVLDITIKLQKILEDEDDT